MLKGLFGSWFLASLLWFHLVATRECFLGESRIYMYILESRRGEELDALYYLWLPRDLHLYLGRHQSCSVEIPTTIRAGHSMDLTCTT